MSRIKAEEARVDKRRADKREKEQLSKTPDKEQFDIVEIERIGDHVVMKVLYPNCAKCSYEGNKVMVFLNAPEKEVVKWKIIDPHFRDPTKARTSREAPGPDARFPASKEGWSDALAYAHGKDTKRK
jgi:hypothetical protein